MVHEIELKKVPFSFRKLTRKEVKLYTPTEYSLANKDMLIIQYSDIKNVTPDHHDIITIKGNKNMFFKHHVNVTQKVKEVWIVTAIYYTTANKNLTLLVIKNN